MSLFKTTKQGGSIVVRDEKGNIVTKVDDPSLADARRAPLVKLRSWRKLLRDLDKTGIDEWLALRAIAHGEPRKVLNPYDGTYTIEVPSISDQRQALTTILEMRFGKAVAQTEVMRAEEEAEDAAQYDSISDKALVEAARPYLERVQQAQARQLKKGDDESDDS